MKIAIFDPNMPKFTEDMVEWWESHGHEVKRSRYYDPELIAWGDVIWFDTCDNNLRCGSYPDVNDPTQDGWDMHKMDLTGKRVICRVIDIEVWYGHQNNLDWNLIDDVIFIAPHIRELAQKDVDFAAHNVRVHDIPCGVNTELFDFVDKPLGKKIAWVCEKWPTKGIDYMLQIMALLPKDYELHTIGGWNDRYPWEKAYQEDFIAKHGIQFFDYEWVPDQNEWLADKDFILSTSKKEAFGYSIAEGMSKGLVPVIHRFYGCDALWDINVWNTIPEAVVLIQHASDNRQQYRDYLDRRGYTTEAMMNKFMEVING